MQFQQLCSMKSEEMYPQRDKLGFQRPKRKQEFMEQWIPETVLVANSLLRRMGIPPGQIGKGNLEFTSTGVHLALTLCKAFCQVHQVHRESDANSHSLAPLPVSSLPLCYDYLYLTVCSIDTLASKYNPWGYKFNTTESRTKMGNYFKYWYFQALVPYCCFIN